jgi:hypothetical protein
MAMDRAMATQGLTTIPSSHGPQDTMNRLEAAVRAKGMTVFAASIMPQVRPALDCRCGRPRF